MTAHFPRDRKRVTICIALACEAGFLDKSPSIVLCSDMQSTSDLGAAQMTFKQRFLAGGWMLSFAGLLIEEEATSRHIRDCFGEAFKAGVLLDEVNIRPLLEEAWRRRKEERANTITVEHLAIRYRELLALGPEKLALPPFASVLAAINQWRPDEMAHYIVAGIQDGLAFLLETPPDGGVPIMMDECAIVGSGWVEAQEVVVRRQFASIKSLGTALLVAYEAKKAAEANPYVGDKTLLCVKHEGNSEPRYLRDELITNVFEPILSDLGPDDALPDLPPPPPEYYLD